MQTGHLGTLFVGIGLLAIPLLGCGDDGGKSDDAGIDAATIQADVMNGVLCTGADANYSGDLAATAAQNDGTDILFRGDLNAGSPPDRLQLKIASNAAMPTGTFDLPAAGWAVSLCIDDPDGSCGTALPAFSGTLRVDSVETRFKANLDRVIFVDSLATPTCSASVTQSSFDVAIDAS
jgi:hypothetical protein